MNNITLIDLGTGSGCIPISILKEIKKLRNQVIKKINCIAVDISSQALLIARKNSKKHNIKKNINFLQGDLLKPIINSKIINPQSSIIITANLPYLTQKQIKNSPSIQKEPLLALDGGDNGMIYYIKLFKQIKLLQKKIQLNSIILLAEIDHTQTDIFKKQNKLFFPQAKLTIKKDLQAYDRLAIIEIKSPLSNFIKN